MSIVAIVAFARATGARGESAAPDPLAWSLVQAEAELARLGRLRRDPYPGGYRAPGYFDGRNLRGLNAQHLTLRGFRFANADMRAADLYKADLRGSDLRGADLRDAVLVSARLEGAKVDARTKLPISADDARARGASWFDH